MKFVLGLALLVWPAVSAAALPADLEFIELITDPADNYGFYDILSVAVAEPGNQTLVVRFEVADVVEFVSEGPTGRSNYLLLEYANGTGIGVTAQGMPVWREENAADVLACWIEVPYAYCMADYAALGLQIGAVLNGPFATAYALGVRAEWAPAPGPVPQANGLGPSVGQSYLVKGCTRSGGCPVLLAQDPANGSGASSGSEPRTSAETTPASPIEVATPESNGAPGLSSTFLALAIVGLAIALRRNQP